MKNTKLPALVKPILHAVLLRVHPDFFVHQPAAKAANLRSVQRLQDLMAPVLTPSESSESPQQSRELTCKPLEFVSRNKPTTDPVLFEFNRHSTRTLVQLQAQRTRDLLGLCNILEVDTPQDSVNEIESIIGQADRQHSKASTIETLIKLRMARLREARENYTRSNPGFDMHAALKNELRNADWSPYLDSSKSRQMELNRRNIFFAANVPPNKYSSIIKHIESQLPKLQYGQWYNLPIMVVASWKDASKGGASRYPGFVIIPDKFKTQELINYLESNIDEIRQERNKKNTQKRR
ncbi:hypothetical protein J3B01_003902 [Coemansia erecta]|nr:hypothetical protein J3B01_003902 [Coemansia erecta]